MKLGQLMEYNRRSIFLEKYVGNNAGRLVPDLIVVLKMLNMK